MKFMMCALTKSFDTVTIFFCPVSSSGSNTSRAAVDHTAKERMQGERDAKRSAEERSRKQEAITSTELPRNCARSTTRDSPGNGTSIGLQWTRSSFDASSAEKPRSSTKSTVVLQQRCMSSKQGVWWDVICEKRDWEADDGNSELEEARVSRILFNLFEQSEQVEATAAATAAEAALEAAARVDRAKTSQ